MNATTATREELAESIAEHNETVRTPWGNIGITVELSDFDLNLASITLTFSGADPQDKDSGVNNDKLFLKRTDTVVFDFQEIAMKTVATAVKLVISQTIGDAATQDALASTVRQRIALGVTALFINDDIRISFNT